MEILKTGRIIDDEAYSDCQTGKCEVCGQPCGNGPHHITTRGAGGSDVPENLIQLCPSCHSKAHNGLIDKDWLRRIAARREKNKHLFGALQ